MSGTSSVRERAAGWPRESPVLILVVSPEEQDHRTVRSMVNPAWELHGAAGIRVATSAIRRLRPTVVICDSSLPDGSWRDLFATLQPLADGPMFIVASRHADDRLWAEVLNLGGYDVLPKPFSGAEVSRVLAMAVRQHLLKTATGTSLSAG